MPEASHRDRIWNIGGEIPMKSITDVCENLKNLQDGQGRLEKQVEDLACTLKMLFDVQRRTSAQTAGFTERSLDRQFPTAPDVESRTMPNGRYPQFNAGQRLTDTFELLEMILLELPSKEVLFAQRTSKRFRSTIAGSCSLQLQLFLTTKLSNSASKNVILNPVLTDENILPRIPLYFNDKRLKLAYCDRGDRRRVYCTTATVVKDDITGQEWVDIQLTNLRPACLFASFDEARQRPISAGSWKQMSFSRPPCDIKWRLALVEDNCEHRYSGIVAGRPTMDMLLDSLAAAVAVDEGEHRHRSNRWRGM